MSAPERELSRAGLAKDENPLLEALDESHANAMLEEALEESFPASDPVSANRFD